MEFSLTILINLSIALALGALIGIDREIAFRGDQEKQIEISGLRTYALISLLGFLGAYLSKTWNIWILLALLVLLGALTIASYQNEYNELKKTGITSEISILLAFLVGALAYLNPQIATVVGVITILILALKYPIHKFTKVISPDEFFAIIKFIIVTFVVLPLLPKEAVDPWGIMVPYEIWLMVVFISAISFVGYIAVKLIGTNKGLEITGLIGGLASSTATTSSMSIQSKHNLKIVLPFVSAVIISSTVMFVRVGFEVFVLNIKLLPTVLIPLSVMIATSLAVIGFFWYQGHAEKKVKSEELKLSSPFQFGPALKFGVFYLFVLAVAHFANEYFGEKGLYIASAVAGLADVDAITISMSRLSASGELMQVVATRAIILAVMMNTMVKLCITFVFGSREFAKKAAIGYGLVFVSGLTTILLIG